VVCERLANAPFQTMAHAQWELTRARTRRRPGVSKPTPSRRHRCASGISPPCSQPTSRRSGRGRSLNAWRSRSGASRRTCRPISLKRESLRGHLLSDEEEVAIMRMISSLAGHRERIRPWRRGDEIG